MEYVPLAFLYPFFRHCIGAILASFIYRYNKLLLSFDDLNVRGLIVNNYICNRMFSKHVRQQNVSNFPLKLT